MTNVFTTPLCRTFGPRFDTLGHSDEAPVQTFGTSALTFGDGNHANVAHTIDGTGGLPVVAMQANAITRFEFADGAGTNRQWPARHSKRAIWPKQKRTDGEYSRDTKLTPA